MTARGDSHVALGGEQERRPAATQPVREPNVYVVLVNWRGWKDTVECLESVFAQDYGRFRVVVCDNASGDGSIGEIVRWAERGDVAAGTGGSAIPVIDRAAAEAGGPEGDEPGSLVVVETGDNLGFAGGNNVGLRYALARGDADYVWLLNNDTVVDRDALRAMVELAESRPDAGMVGSKLLYHDRSDVIQLAAGGDVVRWRGLTTYLAKGEHDRGQWDRVVELDYITGASLLVRKSTVEAIGLLDERYFLYSEEVDWCIRAREAGWKLLYAPGSRVLHKGGQSVGYGSALHDYYSVRSMLLLVQKFSPVYLPVTFLYSLYRCLAPKVVRLQPGRLLAVLRAYRDFARMMGSEALLANPPRPDFGADRSRATPP